MNQINLGDRSGLPASLKDGVVGHAEKRLWAILGSTYHGVVTVYWWVEAYTEREALDRAGERFAPWAGYLHFVTKPYSQGEGIEMRKVKDIVRAQCDRCGLVGDRKLYTDGSYTKTCPHCGKRAQFKILR